ncbi:hypothetical protein GQ457_02G025420 [Hibiscus cannabinus]
MRGADQTMTINVFNTLRYTDDQEECHHLQEENAAAAEDPNIICCSKFIQIKDFEKLKKEDAEELDETPCETHQVSSFTIRPCMRFEALNFSEFTSPKPSFEHAPSLELKPSPPHLKYVYLGYSGYNQIAIAPEDQEKTTFTCPYGTYAFWRMPFGLCNAPTTFQHCMLVIFSDMVEEFLEVFMDDFSGTGETFDSCLLNLAKVLKRCEEADLVLNWEKCHFMVNEGTVLGHKISSKGIEVDKAKVEVIEKLPPPINELKMRLILTPVVVPPDWTSPFEVMCDASDHAVGAALGQ